ncbi:MAG: hypothetical protein DRP57_04140 [Spirochaetes bacterium]|nr:MAG: hypothetical protein DRP57_04140 [Spirochaetota bacterium]
MTNIKGNGKTALVFDFDGTLIDSKQLKEENYVKAFHAVFGTDDKTREIVYESCRKTAGANRFIQLEDTLNKLKITAKDGEKEKWSRTYSNLNKKALFKIEEFPSVRKVLTELSRRGFAMYAASGILDDEFNRELARRKLNSFFNEIHGGDKVGFLKSLKNKDFKRIIFAGDTKYDREAALKAGVEFFLINGDEDIQKLYNLLLRHQ